MAEHGQFQCPTPMSPVAVPRPCNQSFDYRSLDLGYVTWASLPLNQIKGLRNDAIS
jgi:hypothetical protein